MDFKVENITLFLFLYQSLVVSIVEFSQIKIDHFALITDNYNKSSQTYSVDLDRFQTRTKPHSTP